MAILSLVLVVNSMNVFAQSSIQYNRIPNYMNPGTTITFDKNKNVVILEEGNHTKFSKNNTEVVDESILPLAEEGMKVTYDALGHPVIINQSDREQPKVKVDLKRSDLESQTSDIAIPRATMNTQTGYITYYYAAGKMVSSGVTLDEWSAAHMTLSYWTSVTINDLESGTKASKVWVLDRGAFSPKVILDIDAKRFSNSFYPLSKGWFYGKIIWYTS